MRSAVTTATLAVLALPSVLGHMAVWGNEVYGAEAGNRIFEPLANQPFEKWWFHGQAGTSPSGVKTLIPGQTTVMDIACRKAHSAMGNPIADACPIDSGAYHAGGTTCREGDTSCNTLGWQGNQESQLMGCALAIAYKPTASQTNPEDFIVMSVQETCVRQRETPFEIPSNLPACPEGGCTCAWFWAGKNSDLEMYMTGFRCDVQGGVVTDSYPTPQRPTKNADKSGPTQPMYWANTQKDGSSDNLGFTPSWATKPSYNKAYGWTDGAQTGAFAGVAGSGGAVTKPIGNTTNNVVDPELVGDGETESALPTTTARQQARPTTVENVAKTPAQDEVPAGSGPTEEEDAPGAPEEEYPVEPVEGEEQVDPTYPVESENEAAVPVESEDEAAVPVENQDQVAAPAAPPAATSTRCTQGQGGYGRHRWSCNNNWGPDQAAAGKKSPHLERRTRRRAADLGERHV